MKRVVLHASAFVDWMGGDEVLLRADFEAGQLMVIVPRSFVVDTMAILAARGWSADRIERAGSGASRLGFTLTPAQLGARLVARSRTAGLGGGIRGVGQLARRADRRD